MPRRPKRIVCVYPCNGVQCVWKLGSEKQAKEAKLFLWYIERTYKFNMPLSCQEKKIHG